jgi:hypothetical protein
MVWHLLLYSPPVTNGAVTARPSARAPLLHSGNRVATSSVCISYVHVMDQ